MTKESGFIANTCSQCGAQLKGMGCEHCGTGYRVAPEALTASQKEASSGFAELLAAQIRNIQTTPSVPLARRQWGKLRTAICRLEVAAGVEAVATTPYSRIAPPVERNPLFSFVGQSGYLSLGLDGVANRLTRTETPRRLQGPKVEVAHQPIAAETFATEYFAAIRGQILTQRPQTADVEPWLIAKLLERLK